MACDDGGDGIMLNLTPYVFEIKKSSKPSDKHIESKEEKTLKGKTDSHYQRKNPGAKKQYDSNRSDKATKKKYIDPKDFVPISNLFNKNPEIPSAPKYESEKSEEVLFSSENMDDLSIGEKLKSNLKNHMHFTTLTKIQKLSIPRLLKGCDVMLKSPTGSGKTICYSIPIVDKLSKMIPPINRSSGLFALVIVPTRELALQTLDVFQALCKSCISIVPGMLIGGEKCKSEKGRLRKGMNVLIATPGRLIYHMTQTSCLNLSNIEFLVLDEADRLLDMGFDEKVKEIVKTLNDRCSGVRQSILLSATLNPNVKDLALISLKEPVFIDSAVSNENKGEEEDLDYNMPSSLTQYFVTVPAKLRLASLIIFAATKIVPHKAGKAIVFTESKNTAVFLLEAFKLVIDDLFASTSYSLFALHGDMSQQDRFETFKKFKSSQSGILFCTDVASRGLDIKGVDWVIQYSCPPQIDDYLHRIGRTARIGKTGSSVIFLLPSEIEYVKLLHKSSIVPSEIKLSSVLKKFAGGKGMKAIERKAQDLQNKIEEAVTQSNNLKEKAVSGYKSFIQSYATFPKDLKHIFHIRFLHLGHVAKSFGLRETPTNAVGLSHKVKKRKSTHASTHVFKKPKMDDLGEVIVGPRTKKERALCHKKKKKFRRI